MPAGTHVGTLWLIDGVAHAVQCGVASEVESTGDPYQGERCAGGEWIGHRRGEAPAGEIPHEGEAAIAGQLNRADPSV